MVEFLKEAFTGGLSAVETFVGSVGVMSIITFFISIFKIVYDAKKHNKAIEDVKNECEIKLVEFTTKYQDECKALKEELVKAKQQLADMVLLDIKRTDVALDVAKAVAEIYKEVKPDCVEQADAVIEEKEIQVEENQTKQEQVNESLNAIDDLV